MIELTGYQILDRIYSGTRTLVYRGTCLWDKKPVIIKVLGNQYPSFSELLQFRNQYTIAKNLNLPGIIQTYSLEPYQNSYGLVMEDFGGISLKEWTEQGETAPSLVEFCQIAIDLSNTLNILYRHRIIHKDIKPANILINPQTKQVKLIDFSIASLLPRETQTLMSPNLLEGTLGYLSPEQTGRMNRGIDYRTDFYSLGVTFYELLAGELPFKSHDPMELVHSHIAKQPPSLHEINPEIPSVLSAIVSKLMAKNAENRYQSILGLKFDLEFCLHQLKESGIIESFEIAQRDVCDRFTIPEKLYGRETEVETLLQAFERISNGTTEMMLVTGFSGIGKTVVVNEVHKPIVRQRGYFIKGKFDQFNRNIPFSAFVQAFRDLMGQLLSESDKRLTNWQTQILQALGDNGQVIIEIIPELERIIGQQPPAIELSGNAAQNRFNLLFQKFVQIFTTKEHPLVIFLDDLQWADSASLKLMQFLINESVEGYLLLIGAYRDNEVSAVHPLMLILEELSKNTATINTITLATLSNKSLNQLVADTLNCDLKIAQPLTQLLHQKTQGNPFFSTQFLKALYEDGLIEFGYPSLSPLTNGGSEGGWQCDIAQVKALALTDDVVDFMALQLRKLPEATQEMMKLAAGIGNQFDLNTLAIVSEKTEIETATALWKALQEGLIIPQSEIYKFYVGESDLEPTTQHQTLNYKFLHDRVQQAAYSLIPEDKKQATHLKIGQLLQQNFSGTAREEKLFDIVGHLNLGLDLITQPGEREDLAQLNLLAGRKARNATAYNASNVYLQTGIDLLTNNRWQSQYELTLNLYVAATESAYLNGEFEEMEQRASDVLRSAQTILDKVKIYEMQINALTAQSQMLAAIFVGKNALTQLGVEFSSEPDETLMGKALQTLTSQLQGKQIEELVNLPVMSDPQTIAAMQLLAILFSPIFAGNPALLPLHCSTMVSLSLQFGNAPASTIGYATYGMVLSVFLGEVEKGYCFGRLALSVLNQLNVREFKSITLLFFGCFIQHRQEALRAVISTAKKGYLAGIETGDFLNTGYNMSLYLDTNLFAGVDLDRWESEIENYCIFLATVNQGSPLAYLKMKQQTVHNLREIVNEPDLLNGTAYDETVMFPKHHQDNELTAFAFVYIYKLMLAYLFGNYSNALDYIAKTNLYLMAAAGTIHTAVFHFYAGLTYLALFSIQSEIEQANTIALVETHQTTLAQWAHYAPMNHQHKVDLVEAEKCRVLGKKYEAGDWYDRTIFGAKENGYTQEEALANELAAKFYLDWGKEKVAAGYMQEAYYCYARWGAQAKIAHLEQQYPQLLTPIIQVITNPELTNLVTISRGTTKLVTSTSSGQDILLDFSSVMKAAQAISGEIELEKLLATLMQTAIANAGAQTGILVIHQEAEWLVVARANQKLSSNLQIPLVECQELSQNLIYSVARSQTTAVFDDLSASAQFEGDRYIITHQPKSVLCTPISKQGKLIAILYLENNLTVGAFTRDRLQVIELLMAQAAIALENAQLYSQLEDYSYTLEQKVEERTQQLEEKATQLEASLLKLYATQSQLIQTEKMSSLGQLVAGIAHEINNPVNFIHGNLTHAHGYITSLIELIELYEELSPQPQPKIQAKIDEIELEFIIEDLPMILASMTTGTERIRQIVESLRNFSRLDESEIKPIDIHSGIDSTLLILQHRLKASEKHQEIQVIKDYGKIPLINCYASALNQVFMNILSNGIDGLRQQENGSNLKKKLTLMLQTSVDRDRNAVIRIADNGIGIEPSALNKIFEPFFTTKPVGKGTGLGLSVSYAIIVEKHGGKIEVNSTLGEGTEFTIVIPI